MAPKTQTGTCWQCHIYLESIEGRGFRFYLGRSHVEELGRRRRAHRFDSVPSVHLRDAQTQACGQFVPLYPGQLVHGAPPQRCGIGALAMRLPVGDECFQY
jgi:hypothetical protein